MAGASAEGALLGAHLRFTWRGGWSRQLQVYIPGDFGLVARYRPSWRSHEAGLLLPDGTSYRWYAPSAPDNRGEWAGPGIMKSPIFSNLSDRWEVRVAVARPADGETLAVPALLLLLGGYLALTDALGRRSPPGVHGTGASGRRGPQRTERDVTFRQEVVGGAAACAPRPRFPHSRITAPPMAGAATPALLHGRNESRHELAG